MTKNKKSLKGKDKRKRTEEETSREEERRKKEVRMNAAGTVTRDNHWQPLHKNCPLNEKHSC